MSKYILRISEVGKRFGATQALKDISMNVKKGSVHGLVGRNGAGKTTLVNLISGIYPQDRGNIFFEGDEISNLSVLARQQRGMFMVTQHASIIPYLSVAENIFMGLWPLNKTGFVDWKNIYNESRKLLKVYGLNIDPKEEIHRLSAVDQRKINIVRSLFGGAKLVILDEPTTSLSAEERSSLYSFVSNLAKKGTTFLLISHYMEEIISMSDEITVLRDGKAFKGYSGGSINEEKLASLVTGEDIELFQREHRSVEIGSDTILECKNVYGTNMKGISFSLKKGEIVGLVGFPGSGAREICRTIFGLNNVTEGEIVNQGKPLIKSNPSNAIKEGIVYMPNDRHTEGLVSILTVRENICITILNRITNKLGLLKTILEKNIAIGLFNKLRVKAKSIEDKVDHLSGGNQQKVVMAKMMSSNPSILILDEPTVGIDVKSREEILSIIDEMTKMGVGVLYLTNDYGELLRVADRLLIFSEGKVIKDIKNHMLTVEDVIRLRDIKKDGAA